MTTRITSENITDATITATDLAAGAGSTDWQAVIVADGSTVTTMVSGRGYFINTTSAAGIVKLPVSASRGDYVEIKDYARTFNTNSVAVQRNGHKIDGEAADGSLANNGQSTKFVYIDTTRGWTAINDDDTRAYGASYHSATGGTITTSGNYKIHTFTGDGNFVVSSVGNPAGSGDKVSYVVVAGGGAGQSKNAVAPNPSHRYGMGGGGAGGFREGKCSSDPYTDSPLDSGTAITVSATTYPITVGAGGAANAVPSSTTTGPAGSNSVFSTITSAGGGGGGYGAPQPQGIAGAAGGSGGGGGGSATPVSSGGAGNTPPVSPPQGQPGGTGTDNQDTSAGGGGGATGGGGNAATTASPRTNDGGDGGAGATTNITGSPVTYAGGGGGGAGYPGGPGTGVITPGAGGSGGGGRGGGPPSNPTPRDTTCGEAGTANVGGGGGGAGGTGATGSCAGGAGGKGVVIIRYKYIN